MCVWRDSTRGKAKEGSYLYAHTSKWQKFGVLERIHHAGVTAKTLKLTEKDERKKKRMIQCTFTLLKGVLSQRHI